MKARRVKIRFMAVEASWVRESRVSKTVIELGIYLIVNNQAYTSTVSREDSSSADLNAAVLSIMII